MWSLVTLLTYKAYDYKTMIVCRFLLGLFEAPVSSLIQLLAQNSLTFPF